MNKYQIVELTSDLNHAGTKAPNDITHFTKDEYKILNLIRLEGACLLNKIVRQFYYLLQWKKIYSSIQNDSILLLQHPIRTKMLGRKYFINKLKMKKNVNIISLVHDVEEIRDIFDLKKQYYEQEFKEMTNFADIIIVHNNKMKEWFWKKGFKNTITLELFDYHSNNTNDEIKFSKIVNIAGNLSIEKGRYIYTLDELKETTFNLMGPNFNEKYYSDNINYIGSFPADEVYKKLNTGFGLIWDGDSLELCDGKTGNYLKYNNPHKMSLYLSAGIPVIIWKQAAQAKFVEDNNIGFAVNSLYELEEKLKELSEDGYKKMLKNVNVISEKIRKGHYIKKSILESEKIIFNR